MNDLLKLALKIMEEIEPDLEQLSKKIHEHLKSHPDAEREFLKLLIRDRIDSSISLNLSYIASYSG